MTNELPPHCPDIESRSKCPICGPLLRALANSRERRRNYAQDKAAARAEVKEREIKLPYNDQ